jgi:hypothetical protein
MADVRCRVGPGDQQILANGLVAWCPVRRSARSFAS